MHFSKFKYTVFFEISKNDEAREIDVKSIEEACQKFIREYAVSNFGKNAAMIYPGLALYTSDYSGSCGLDPYAQFVLSCPHEISIDDLSYVVNQYWLQQPYVTGETYIDYD